MTWSYIAAQLSSSDLFKVRYLIGDVKAGDQQQQDEEITFALSERGSIYGAAAMCCQALAAKFAREADTSDKDLHDALSQRCSAYRKMAIDYEAKADNPAISSGPAVLVAGLPSSFQQ